MAHPLWPLYDLRLRTPRLEMRLAHEDDVIGLCAVAKAGIHDPSTMPFSVPWTDAPSPEFERGFLQWHARGIAGWTAGDWRLPLTVFLDGQPVGVQDVTGTNFALLREVSTGSWLGQAFQGAGFGKEMRAAVLHFAFEGLGAEVAYSAANVDNHSSLGVSRALGYEDSGLRRAAPRGEVVEQVGLRLTRERWAQFRSVTVEIEGLDGCLDMFGL